MERERNYRKNFSLPFKSVDKEDKTIEDLTLYVYVYIHMCVSIYTHIYTSHTRKKVSGN